MSWRPGWPFWLGVLLVLGLWMLGAYNRITGLRAVLLKAWGALDELLLARSAALHALLAAAAEPLAGERAALDTVTQALTQLEQAHEAMRRRPTTPLVAADLAKADAVLGAVSARLLALVSQDLGLRQSAAVQGQLKALQEQGTKLGFARQGFNDAAARLDEAVTQFPTRLLAPVFGFGPAGRV